MTGDTEGCIDQACVRHATASTTEALRLGRTVSRVFRIGSLKLIWEALSHNCGFFIDYRIVSAPEISNPISVNAVALCSRESVMP